MKLLAAMSAERDALRGFVGLLEREQNALVENQTDHLLKLSEQKSTSALALAELIETRHALLKNCLTEISTESIQTWLQMYNRHGLVLWLEICALAEHARQLNQNSGELIKMKLRHNQQLLTALGGAANKSGLYGRDGQPRFAPDSSRSLGNG